MRNICKTCKTQRRAVVKKYHLGVRSAWECKCGYRMMKSNEVPHEWMHRKEEDWE